MAGAGKDRPRLCGKCKLQRHGEHHHAGLDLRTRPGRNLPADLRACGGQPLLRLLSRGLEQITSDHSVVGALLRSGNITSLEARVHPKKHVLTQALGSPDVKIELISRDLEPGSLVLLCTDGLSDLVDDSQIANILQKGFDSNDLAQDLVDLANAMGGIDNITVIVAEV